MGRPTLCTDAVTARIVEAIEAGKTLGVAAELAGIHSRTASRWMAWGRDGNEEYRPFCQAVTRAQAKTMGDIEAVVRDAALSDPQHAEWWLERRNPEQWGRKNIVRIETQRELGKILDDVQGLVSEGAYGELVRAFAVLAGMDEAETGDAAEAAGPVEH